MLGAGATSRTLGKTNGAIGKVQKFSLNPGRQIISALQLSACR